MQDQPTQQERWRLLRGNAALGAGLVIGFSLRDLPGWAVGVSLGVIAVMALVPLVTQGGAASLDRNRRVQATIPVWQQVLASASGAAPAALLTTLVGTVPPGFAALYVGAAMLGTALGVWFWRKPADDDGDGPDREARAADRERRAAADLAEQQRRERDWRSTGP